MATIASQCASRDINPAKGRWRESRGEYSILAGSSLITHCEPHFHETYILAYLRRGTAAVQVRDRVYQWESGQIFLANPHEIVSGGADGQILTYDVCYPCRRFMSEAFGLEITDRSAQPRLNDHLLTAELASELGALLGSFTASDDTARSSGAAEQALIEFFRANPLLVDGEWLSPAEAAWVRRICTLIENMLEQHVSISSIADQMACDRSHLMRTFRKATGLAPSSYLRQLRLAKALQQLRRGMPIAETSALCGFSDQAHLTREFKRVYGTTPGQLSRDLSRPCHQSESPPPSDIASIQ